MTIGSFATPNTHPIQIRYFKQTGKFYTGDEIAPGTVPAIRNQHDDETSPHPADVRVYLKNRGTLPGLSSSWNECEFLILIGGVGDEGQPCGIGYPMLLVPPKVLVTSTGAASAALAETLRSRDTEIAALTAKVKDSDEALIGARKQINNQAKLLLEKYDEIAALTNKVKDMERCNNFQAETIRRQTGEREQINNQARQLAEKNAEIDGLKQETGRLRSIYVISEAQAAKRDAEIDRLLRARVKQVAAPKIGVDHAKPGQDETVLIHTGPDIEGLRRFADHFGKCYGKGGYAERSAAIIEAFEREVGGRRRVVRVAIKDGHNPIIFAEMKTSDGTCYEHAYQIQEDNLLMGAAAWFTAHASRMKRENRKPWYEEIVDAWYGMSGPKDLKAE